jgi:1-acyl-sn-glycerol-3-phosphate acyltransferase
VSRLISASLIFFVKAFARLFYRFEVNNFGDAAGGGDPWRGVRLLLLLNHTSLFEPLFMGVLPNWFLWALSGKLVAPGADKTLNRPFVGRFFRFLAPRMVPITRKRDASWSDFMQMVLKDAIVIILPEGRMKRRNGLDANGKPMSIRGGVGDVLNVLSEGKMAIAYSGGLHHIQAPGEWFPRLFKTIRVNVEFLDILTYKQELGATSIHEFKLKVAADLTERQKIHTPLPLPS